MHNFNNWIKSCFYQDFIATMSNIYEIMKCVNENDGKTFGNEFFYIDIPEKRLDTLPLFGARYNFY